MERKNLSTEAAQLTNNACKLLWRLYSTAKTENHLNIGMHVQPILQYVSRNKNNNNNSSGSRKFDCPLSVGHFH